jgi:formylglycine-generating enzyme required for sulfatase activity
MLPAIFILSSTFAKPQALAPYAETLPKSVVKVSMVPVAAAKPFWIASTETTWEAYDVFLASGPASPAYDQTEFDADAIARPSKSYILPDLGWGHHGYPAINISSTSAEMFCRWLSSVTKKKYRLPTDAEWTAACRAGKTGKWNMDPAEVEKYAWHKGNSKAVTHAVKTKAANELGIYDILGNVGEWATDKEGKLVLCGGTFRDPITAMVPDTRRYWAPAWQETDPQLPKSRWWLADAPFAGFRVVCEP